MDSKLVFPALVAGRLLLSLIVPYDVLRHDHLLSSPLTSFLRLQEGVYLFKNAITDPYSGGVFRHSPLYLALFSTVLPTGKRSAAALWTACDMLGAWALVRIWRARSAASQGQQNKDARSREGIVAASYLVNPYIVLPSLALSTSSFDNTLTLLTIMLASEGRISATLLALAVLTHFSVFSALLLVPLFLLLISSPASRLASPGQQPRFSVSFVLKRSLPLMLEFVVYVLSLTLCSTLVAGGWSWVDQSWAAALMLPDLTPNCGLWWYFFIEIFDDYRNFFLMVFSVHVLIYVVPICIKFHHDPLYATHIILGILGVFKSYPTLSDPGLFLSMIALFPETYPFLRHPFVTTLLQLHASLLMPLFHHLWLSQGTANANFFYASTLVFGCANGAALVDCTWAGLRTAIGEVKEGWAVVQE